MFQSNMFHFIVLKEKFYFIFFLVSDVAEYNLSTVIP